MYPVLCIVAFLSYRIFQGILIAQFTQVKTMLGDPALLEDAKDVPAFLSAANLLAVVDVKLPPF